jgi:hypothetical protein
MARVVLPFEVMQPRSDIAIDISDHRHLHARPLGELCRELLGLVVSPARVVSLFVDCDWRDEQQRERARLFVKHQAARLAKLAADSSADLEHAVRFADQLAHRAFDEQFAGVAAFFCAPLDLDLVVRVHRPLEQRLHLGSRPLLGPLLRALADGPPAVVALASRQMTRLWEFSASAARTSEVIAREVPRHHAQGGWSQLKLQHHSDLHAHWQLGEAALAITRHVDELGGFPVVVIGGPPAPVAELIRLLPTRISERVQRLEGTSRYDSDALVLARAEQVVQRYLAAERERDVALAISWAMGGLRGVAGRDPVVEAANRSRIERLLLSDRLRAEATRCDECGVLSARPQDVCPVCDSETERVRLEDALPEVAAALSAAIEMVHGDSRLEEVGHVAALLRW